MRPRKEIIKRYQENGSEEKILRSLSAIQVLNAVSNTLLEEANEILLMNGMCIGEIKKVHSGFVKSSDAYFETFAKLVDTEESKRYMFEDMDEIEEYIRKWAKLPKGWLPEGIKR